MKEKIWKNKLFPLLSKTDRCGEGEGGGKGGGGGGGEGGGGEAGFDVDAAHLTVTTPPMAKFCYEIRSDIQNICF